MALFIDQCNQSGLHDVNKYINMIQHHYKKAILLLHLSIKDPIEFYRDTDNVKVTKIENETKWVFDNHKMGYLDSKLSIYYEMSLFYIYTYFDYFAHILNIVVLSKAINENDISFSRVIHIIKQKHPTHSLTKQLLKVKQSPEYKYLNAFVNTLKHRSISYSWHTLQENVEITEDSEISEICAFEYKSEKYHELKCPKGIIELGRTVHNNYIPKICEQMAVFV